MRRAPARPNPDKSLLDEPLAIAIRVGEEWLKLDNHVVVECGLSTGQLELKYFSTAGKVGRTAVR